MVKFEGTPGPWEVVEHNDELMVIQAGSLERGFGWSSYTSIASDLQGSPDANLIAAAPELLEALLDLFHADCMGVKGCDAQMKALEKASLAINKALGQ